MTRFKATAYSWIITGGKPEMAWAYP